MVSPFKLVLSSSFQFSIYLINTNSLLHFKTLFNFRIKLNSCFIENLIITSAPNHIGLPGILVDVFLFRGYFLKLF